jgi:6-phosphogluconolactonase (cycloisomerase 2 family)
MGTSPNPNPNPTVVHSKFLYVVNSIENTVLGYVINAVTGTFTPVGPSVPADEAPIYAAASPDGKFLYVANAGASSRGVSGFHIDSATGVLTATTPSTFPITGSSEPLGIVVDPTSTHLYTTNTDSISAFTINPITGVLTDVPGTPVFSEPETSLQNLAITPDGHFLYATDSQQSMVWSFSIDATGLPVAMGTPVAAGKFPEGIVIDPSGKFVYVANWNSDDISRFTITPGTGVLVPESPRTPVDLHCGPQEIAVDPTSKFLFVSCAGLSKIDQFGINTTTGFLTPMTSFATGQFTQPRGIAVDRSGLFIYSAWNQQNRAGTAAIAANGDMTPVTGTSSTGRGPIGVVLSGNQ